MKKIYLLPKTILGKWSVWLILLFFLVFVILIVTTRIQGPKNTTESPINIIYFIPLILQVIFSVGSLITGIISIIKKTERSILVFISTLIGLFVLWFVIGEILVPH